MGVRNYLVEGVSGTGKTTVCDELTRRGYEAIHGDRVLAYQGDPDTGAPTQTRLHGNHIWDVERVREFAADQAKEVTFFCGGSRNFSKFIDVFDEVFVLQVDVQTLMDRLDQRVPGDWGSETSERELIVRLHATQDDVPRAAVIVNADRPIEVVVDDILDRVGANH